MRGEPRRILEDTAHEYGLEVADITSRRKGRWVATARAVAAHRLKALEYLSILDIASLLHRDHTTILYYLRSRDENGHARR